MTGEQNNSLLRVSDLKMHFPVRGGIWRRRVGAVYAVDGVSLTLDSGKTLGLVGSPGVAKPPWDGVFSGFIALPGDR